jgi:hypothetical protein
MNDKKWTELDEAEYRAAINLMKNEDFRVWMARLEREARRPISLMGEMAGTVAPQILVATMAMYNTVERIPREMEKYVMTVKEGKDMEAKALQEMQTLTDGK